MIFKLKFEMPRQKFYLSQLTFNKNTYFLMESIVEICGMNKNFNQPPSFLRLLYKTVDYPLEDTVSLPVTTHLSHHIPGAVPERSSYSRKF